MPRQRKIRTIKSMKGMYAEAMEDENVAELDSFLDAYKFSAHELFASAGYIAVSQSMNKACRPASLPEEVHLQKLKSFIATEIERVTTGRRVEVEEYVLLRSLDVCRQSDYWTTSRSGGVHVLLRSLNICSLTLVNGRRGEEPARMFLSEWDDARNGEWIRRHEVCTTK